MDIHSMPTFFPAHRSSMSLSSCVATTLSTTERQELALQVLTKTGPVTSIAKQHQVSRKFLYQQSNRANDALEEAPE